MIERIIHSWEELQAVIFEDVWDASIERYRNNKVFRGVTDSSWGLLPALNRCVGDNLGLEKQILRSFRKYGYAELQNIQSFWQLLATGQHFGLPTRLLDWSYSPLVAAHFATEDVRAYDRPGCIFVADMAVINHKLPDRLRALLLDDGATVFSQDMLDRHVPTMADLQALSDTPFALFFEPASTVSRIENQYALFSLISDTGTLMDQLPGLKAALTRIIIPAAVKLEIRDKLDYLNISERMLYPGLDGICQWIARRYAPLGPIYNRPHISKSISEEARP